MQAESSALEDAASCGLDLDRNAFILVHSWTAGNFLLNFVQKAKGALAERPRTAGELAAATGLHEGPLAVALRVCSIMGYTVFDPDQGTYTLATGPEAEELDAHFAPSSATAQALQGLYAEALPPFKLPSQQASRCFQVWRECRPAWKNSKSQVLALVLDGIVLTPLLVSVAYNAHWDDNGQAIDEDSVPESLEFGGLDEESLATLKSIFEELGVGEIDPQGQLSLRPECWEALLQAEAFFLATSYAPLVSRFHKVLTEEPGWGFQEEEPEEEESPVRRLLQKAGAEVMESSLKQDLLRHINSVFGGEDFEAQPKFIMEIGCGDGSLLAQIYEHIQKNLPRGQLLDQHPLTVIGVDHREDMRMAAAVNLSSKEVPHITQKGDIAKPAETMALLKKNKKKKVDPTKILHIRAFQDHCRNFTRPAKQHAEDSRLAAYAKAQMVDFVHLDKEGQPIKAADIFASLVEHFERWSSTLEGSFGCCILEEMMLDIPTSRQFFNDSVGFSSDVFSSLARQYKIAPGAFVMAGAMAGLFPAKYDQVQNYPEQGKYTLVLHQHLVRKPFRLRLAELSDLPELLRLEAIGWAQELRKGEEQLRRRLETSPTTCFVCEMAGKLIAVLYVQKVASLDAIDAEVFESVSDAHDPNGRILQLLSIIGDVTPEVKALGIGNELRCFVLHMARMDPGVDFVCAVTRCGDFRGEASEMQAYVDDHVSGKLVDSVVGFHTGYGAKVVKIVPNYRPEDTDNKGIGVLIQYDIKDWKAQDQAAVDGQRRAKQQALAQVQAAADGEVSEAQPGLELVIGIMSDIGFTVDEDSIHQGFFSFEMDSLDLVRVRNRIGVILGYELPTTLLLDYPNAAELGEFMDKERGIGKYKDMVVQKTVWEKMQVQDITFILDKFVKFYSLPQYKRKFAELHDKAPSAAKYADSIAPIRQEVEGPILVANEVIQEAKPDLVLKAREEFAEWLTKYGGLHPKIRLKHNEMLDLIKMRPPPDM